MSFVAVAAGVSAATGLYKVAKGIKQDKLANSVVVPDATYEKSPYALAMLDNANRIQNSRMIGAGDAEDNIFQNDANAAGGVSRNATSGSNALAALAGVQGNTNNAFNGLRAQEGNDFWMKQNALNNADMAMTAEGDKAYQDAVRKRQEAIAEKNALRGAATQNTGGGVNTLVNSAFMYAQNKNNNSGDKTPTFF